MHVKCSEIGNYAASPSHSCMHASGGPPCKTSPTNWDGVVISTLTVGQGWSNFDLSYTTSEEKMLSDLADKILRSWPNGWLKMDRTNSGIHLNISTKFLYPILISKRPSGTYSDVRTLKTLYCSLVRSQLEYGSIVWSPYTQRNILKIERVQRRATITKFILRTDDSYDIRLCKL